LLEKLIEYESVWFIAAVTEAELGKKEVIHVNPRRTELDVALKKQKMPAAEPQPSLTRNYSLKLHCVLR